MGYRCCEEDLGKDPDLIRRGTVEPQTLWIPQQSQAVVQSGGPPERSEEEAWFKTGPAILVLHVCFSRLPTHYILLYASPSCARHRCAQSVLSLLLSLRWTLLWLPFTDEQAESGPCSGSHGAGEQA